jgi:probable HAF family extracellular repeat protein
MSPSSAYLPGLLALVVAAVGCGGDSLSPPTTGTLEVTTSTGGVELDLDGYSLQIDAEPAQTIGSSGTLQTAAVAPGNHTVQLTGIAANCSAGEANPRTVSIAAGETTTVSFTVSCSATTGSVQVSSSSSGPSPDADGYTLTLDGSEHGTLGPSGAVSVEALQPGDHLVGLSGVAGNCQVQGNNPRTVTVTAGQGAEVTFTVTCSPPPPNVGTLRIAAATTGPDPDPNGYTFAVDGGATQSLAVNATATLTNVSVGVHRVRLSGVAGNCAVQGTNPRSATVSSGATVDVSFAITCTGTTGSLEIMTATTGARPDPDGYTVSVDGGSTQSIAINSTFPLPNVAAGPHSVALAGLAPNCSVQGENPQQVTVTVGQRGVVRFAVSCPIPPATYRAIDLGTLGGTSRANAINAAGQVVGQSEIPRVNLHEDEPTKIHAFLWENGVMTDLGTVGHSQESRANDINASGQVVGGSGGHAFLWEKGVMTDLDTLGCAGCNEAYGINDAGQVVGALRVPLPAPRNGWDSHAFLWENGVVTDLGTLGGSYSVATAINAAGQVVGVGSIPGQENTYHAFLWERGVMTDLGSLGGTTEATDINAAGQVVGLGRAPVPGQMVRNYHFLWKNGVMTDMATVGNPGSAQAINAAGQIVGWTRNPPSTQQELRPLIWQEGVVTLLPRQGAAWNINDEGQVVGESSINNGNLHATLWTRE